LFNPKQDSMLHTLKLGSKMALAALLSAFLAFAPALTINPANAQTSETLLVALVTSGAVDDGPIRRQALQGAQFAVDLINAGGGVVDPDSPVNNPKIYKFRLVERAAPTNSEMRTALQASVEDKPIGIIGPNLTAQANNNLDLASTARIPQLISTPSDPTGSNGFTFRARANDSALMTVMRARRRWIALRMRCVRWGKRLLQRLAMPPPPAISARPPKPSAMPTHKP
jgi:ABC-type branched-subunit amino acid transport system substrate-binding protein